MPLYVNSIAYNLHGIIHFFSINVILLEGRPQHAPETYQTQYNSAAMSGAMMHVMF
jgi:hypothetical protein